MAGGSNRAKYIGLLALVLIVNAYVLVSNNSSYTILSESRTEIKIAQSSGDFLFKPITHNESVKERIRQEFAKSEETIVPPTFSWPIDEQQQNLSVITPHDLELLHNPGYKICGENGGEDVDLVAIVASEASRFQNRLSIRSTWANKLLNPKMRLVFMLGNPDKRLHSRLHIESDMFNDIIQENFNETKNYNVSKKIGAFKWISQYCSRAHYVLQVSDNMVVNSHYLLKYLREIDTYYTHEQRNSTTTRLSNTIMCNYTPKEKVVRWKTNTRALTYDQYKPDYFEPHCEDLAYVLTTDLAEKLYRVSLYEKKFRLGDVYIGMLARKLGVRVLAWNKYYMKESSSNYQLASRRQLDTLFFIETGLYFNILTYWDKLMKRFYETVFYTFI